tara:strand:+ start:83 stop:253 length:171 start_codon:yes stop_codon:yes gene_type:complete
MNAGTISRLTLLFAALTTGLLLIILVLTTYALMNLVLIAGRRLRLNGRTPTKIQKG